MVNWARPPKHDIAGAEDTQLGQISFARPEGTEAPPPQPQQPDSSNGIIGLAGLVMPALGAVTGKQANPLDLIPWAKYLRSEDREQFSRLSTTDQTKALLWEDLMFATMIPGAGKVVTTPLKAMAGLAGKAIGKVGGKAKLALKPIEDVFQWDSTTYKEALGKTLEKGKYHSDEIEGIYSYMQGNKEALSAMLREKVLGKKNLSSALNEVLEVADMDTKTLTKLPQTLLKVASEFANSIGLTADFTAKHSHEVIKSNALRAYFGKVAAKRQIFGKSYKTSSLEAAFKAEATKYYGAEATSQLSLAQASDQQLANFAASMLKAPVDAKLAIQTPIASLFRPVRKVFGIGETRGLGTYNNIYQKAEGILGAKNTYVAEKVELFQAMLQQRGLTRRVYKGGSFKLVNTKEYSSAVRKEAFQVLRATDDIMGRAREINTSEALATARSAISNLINPAKPEVRNLVSTVHDYFDHLYAERSIWKIQDLFGKLPLTQMGREGFEAVFSKLAPKIEATFSTGSSLNYEQKLTTMQEILGGLKQAIPLKGKEASPWLKLEGKALTSTLDDLGKQLSYAPDGSGFLPYLENYVARIGQQEMGVTERIFNTLGSPNSPTYAKARSLATAEANNLIGLEELVTARTSAQGKEMFMFQGLEDMAGFASKLPRQWRQYTEHFMARLMGLPSTADEHIAKALQATIGKITGGVWDSQRVVKLGRDVNDLSYMGFLGLRPFSAMRNLFQPLLTVPADLGGIKDYTHLAKGLKSIKANKQTLDQIGVTGEFIPEQMKTLNFLNAPSIKQQTHDVSMWLYGASDKFTRYLAGSASLEKWNSAIKVFGEQPASAKATYAFMKKAGVLGRHSWVKNQIETLVVKGKMAEARSIFVKDVVADTQFLYGALDSPLIGQGYGAAGKTATLFQSWWMNYGDLLGKWITNGTGGDKINRMGTWMLSSAIAYETLAPIWGSKTAITTGFTGPFPDPSRGLPMPPSWKPVADSINIVYNIPGYIIEGDSKLAKKHIKAVVDSTTNFLPGGLQIKKMIKGGMKEGPTGVGKAILNIPLKR